jgi:hypothetical protein
MEVLLDSTAHFEHGILFGCDIDLRRSNAPQSFSSPHRFLRPKFFMEFGGSEIKN